MGPPLVGVGQGVGPLQKKRRTLELCLDSWIYIYIYIYCEEYCSMGLRGRFYPYLYQVIDIGIGYITGLYLGRAPRTKETLPDFHEWRRVTRH